MSREVPIRYPDDVEYMAAYNALKAAYYNQIRVRLWYGSHQTGGSYNEEYDIIGYIGKSTGTEPAFLLVFDRRSMGGRAVYPEQLVGVQEVQSKRFLYKHAKFNKPEFFLFKKSEILYEVRAVLGSGEIITWATFTNSKEAKAYADFMNGKRMRKCPNAK